MTDIVERLRDWVRFMPLEQEPEAAALREAIAEITRLREVVGFVDSWVSNPVGGYSVAALDGLFGMTRDKIRALAKEAGQ